MSSLQPPILCVYYSLIFLVNYLGRVLGVCFNIELFLRSEMYLFCTLQRNSSTIECEPYRFQKGFHNKVFQHQTQVKRKRNFRASKLMKRNVL